MVVILLLTPPYTQHDGCDGAGSNGSSSTSTGETAISANTYKVHSQQEQQQQQQQQQKQQQYNYLPTKIVWKEFKRPQKQQQQQQLQQPKQYHFPYSSHSSSINNNDNKSRYSAYSQSFPAKNWNCRCRFCNTAPASPPLLPPRLPKNQTKPPHDTYYKWNKNNDTAVNSVVDGNHYVNNDGGPANIVSCMQPDKSFYGIQDQWFNAAGNTNHVTFSTLTHVIPKRQKKQKQQKHKKYADNRSNRPQQVDNIEFFTTTTTPAYIMPTSSNFNNSFTNTFKNNINNNNNSTTTTSDYVRHVTRVNFYDVDTSQVEFNSKDNNNNNNNNHNNNKEEEAEEDKPLDTEAITKEGKFQISKKKSKMLIC